MKVENLAGAIIGLLLTSMASFGARNRIEAEGTPASRRLADVRDGRMRHRRWNPRLLQRGGSRRALACRISSRLRLVTSRSSRYRTNGIYARTRERYARNVSWKCASRSRSSARTRISVPTINATAPAIHMGHHV